MMGPMAVLDHDRCYRAVQSRDPRFDGWFVDRRAHDRHLLPAELPGRHAQAPATSSSSRPPPPPSSTATGRASGAAPTPRPARRSGTSAATSSPGRCASSPTASSTARASPASPAASPTASATSTALVTDELGAGPLAIARAQRAQTARTLIETTDLDFTTIAFAAGFGSVRQFNDTVRDVFAATPTALRARRPSRRRRPAAGAVELDLAVREPFDAAALLAFLAARAIPGVEHWDGTSYHRTLDLPHGHGVAAAVRRRPRRSPAASSARGCGSPTGATSAPPSAASAGCSTSTPTRSPSTPSLGADPALAPLVAAVARPARSPGSVDPFETAVRAVVGQQISVAGARTVAGRIVAAAGEPLRDRRRPADARVPDARPRSPRSTRRRCRCRRAAGARSSSWRRASPTDASSSTRGADRDEVAAALARRAGHRPVDGRLRADARARRPRRVPADRPRRPGRPRPPRRRRRRTPSAGARGARTPSTTCGRSPDDARNGGRLDDHVHAHDRQPDRSAHADRRATAACARSASRTSRAGRRRRPAGRPDRSRAGRGRPPARRVLRRRRARSSTCRSSRSARRSSSPRGGRLTTIPYGETVSYGEQARRLGHAGKARAVGAANGRNPLPIIVPCHRVDRRRRQPHRLRRRPRDEGVAARPRTPASPARPSPFCSARTGGGQSRWRARAACSRRCRASACFLRAQLLPLGLDRLALGVGDLGRPDDRGRRRPAPARRQGRPARRA